MNRKTKFRAWLKDEKKMIDVKAIDWDSDGDIFSVNYPEGKAYSGYDKDDIELLEYTGLKDKNGVEIYEGYILKHFKGNIYIVEFHNAAFKLLRYNPYKGIPIAYYSFNTFYDMGNMNELEVIGNIYENPELLEVSDE